MSTQQAVVVCKRSPAVGFGCEVGMSARVWTHYSGDNGDPSITIELVFQQQHEAGVTRDHKLDADSIDLTDAPKVVLRVRGREAEAMPQVLRELADMVTDAFGEVDRIEEERRAFEAARQRATETASAKSMN